MAHEIPSSRMIARRHWYTSLVVFGRTIARTYTTLTRQGLGQLVPLFGLLLLGTLILWVVNTIAPLAPFVYSLF